MFEEYQDKVAVEKLFLEIFEKEDKKALIRIFLKQFLVLYNTAKAELLKKGDKTATIIHLLSAAENNLLESRNKQKSGKAYWLGSALGLFMSTIDKGIATPSYKLTQKEEILTLIRQISMELKSLKRTVKLKFIEGRILAIARKNADKLAPGHQKFIAQIAAMFA